jgi:protein phosphatase
MFGKIVESKLEAAAQTYIGERPANQDRMFLDIVAKSDGQRCGIFCIADGMGGLKDGERAAELAVESVSQWWLAFRNTGVAFIEKEHTKLFKAVNAKLIEFAKKQKTSPGTTLTLLIISGDDYYIAHTGDTRIYSAQKQTDGVHCQQLTKDHTWGAEKLREGVLTQEEINAHRKKNMLTGCLGIFEEPKIFTATGKIINNSVFLLCTDGLYKAFESKSLMAIALDEKPTQSVEILINEAQNRGTKDNASVVVIHTN